MADERSEQAAHEATTHPEPQVAEAASEGSSEARGDGRVSFTPEQQRELERIIAERLERERRKLERERAEVERRAREAALAEQQDYQRLAEERAQRIAELEAEVARLRDVEATLDQYRALMQQQNEALLRQAPKVIREALTRLDPLEQARFLAEHADELRPRAAVPPTPEGAGMPRISEEDRRRRTVSVRDLW
jgi:fused signal recognition particle receptor